MASDQLDFVNKFLIEHKIKTLEDVNSYNDYREYQRKLITRGVPIENGLIRVIDKELELYDLVQQKIKELKINRAPNLKRLRNTGKKVLGIGYLRINEFYTHLFEVFGMTPAHLDRYIGFCTNNILIDECSQFMSAMINTSHSYESEIFVLAARFEFKKRRNIRKARQFYELGLSQHEKCSTLILNEVLLEVEHSDMSDICLNKYKNAIATYPHDITFPVKLLNGTLAIYPQTLPKMSSLIVSDMADLYKHDELLWHHLAQLELKGYTYHPQLAETERFFLHKKTPLETVKSCMNIYEDILNQTVLNVNKCNLSKLHLDALIDIRKSDFMKHACIEKYMNEKIEDAFQSAHLKGAIRDDPKYYLYWANNSSDHDKLMILSGALDVMRRNMTLWEELMSFYISMNNTAELTRVLNKAIRILGYDALPLWNIVLRYLLNTNEHAVEMFFRTGCFSDCDEMAVYIRQQYLEYCVIKNGIDDGRSIFETIKLMYPQSPKIYLEMINLEKIQLIETEDEKKKVRELLVEACSKFGNENYEVWTEYIQFEYEYGTPTMANELFKIALTSVNPDFVPLLESKYDEIKAIYTTTTNSIDDDSMEQLIMDEPEE